MSVIEIITILIYLLLLSGFVYHFFSLFCVWEFFSGPENKSNPAAFTPVSILKPLKGIDPELRENLRSFCRQEYPEYEVLLGFSRPSDNEIEQLTEKILPFIDECNAWVVTSVHDLGANKKISNLEGLVRAAKYPMLAISDSDMRVDPFYLRTIAAEYHSNRNTGLVTCLYKISDPRSPGSALESLTIALDFLPSVLVARRLEGVTFGLGASMLLSKKGLDDIGGLPAIADFLADDYQIGNRLSKKGYSVVLSRIVIENIVGSMSVMDHLTHQIRWARTYRASRPKGFAGYGITHIFPFSLALLALQGPTAQALSVFGIVLVVRFTLVALVYRRVIRKPQWKKWVVLVPVKDCISFVIWAWSLMNRTVTWRGRKYRIIEEGRIVEKI